MIQHNESVACSVKNRQFRSTYYPVLHSVHFLLMFFCILYVCLASVCPYFGSFSYLYVHSSSLSPPSPPASVCQCLSNQYSQLLGALRCLKFHPFYSPRKNIFYKRLVFLTFLLLICGDVESNPGPVDFASLNIRSACSVTDSLDKPSCLVELIADYSLDILALTETWLSSDSPSEMLKSLTPPNYTLINHPRSTGRGGGIAVVFRSYLKISKITLPLYNTFEILGLKLCVKSCSYNIFIFYRPPSSSMSVFLDEFASFLTDVSASGDLILSGDFNIHVNNNTCTTAKSFLELLDSFDLINHIHSPTHISNNTLDLLISRHNSNIISDCSVFDPLLSDHYVVKTSLNFISPVRPPYITKQFRKISTIDHCKFSADILASALYTTSPTNLHDYMILFKSTLLQILNKHAPQKVIKVSSKQSKPFITPEIKQEKAKRSRLETKYRKTRALIDLVNYKNQAKIVSQLITNSRRAYFRNLINNSASNPHKLWSALNGFLNRTSSTVLPSSDSSSTLASSFVQFFACKIHRLSANISCDSLSPHSPPYIAPPIFSNFPLVTESEVKNVILSCSDSTCCIDFIPTKLLKSCIDSLLPAITKLFNFCIAESTFPIDFKYAVVTPLLKKDSLPKDDLNSYRPISNLNFLSKVLERIIFKNLSIHLKSFSSLSSFQSAYKMFHSVETALLKIQNDLLLSVDKRQVSALVLLDLSAAFDTVDHHILLSRLKLNFGISGSALSLLTSYLSDRSQSVVIDSSLSESITVTRGVPQGSVLGPLLFSLYTTPLTYLLKDSGLSFHLYADDTQIYISFKACDSVAALSILSNTLDSIYHWLSRNRLFLNPSKTEFLLVGSTQQCAKLNLKCLSFSGYNINASDSVRNLGVIFDSTLSLNKHISSVTKICHNTIRLIRQIRPSLDKNSAVLLGNALVISKLDFCNSLYYGLPKSSIYKLQLVQNSLARLVMPSTKKYDHISPVLRELHWLPVEQRIKYKIALLTFKTLNNSSPSYLLELLTPSRSVCNVRSNNKSLLTVPRIFSTAGQRSFSYGAPYLWNSLPFDLRCCKNINTFRSKLKTHFFPP